MKKLIIGAMLLLLYAGNSQAQTEDTDNRKKLQFGFKAGLNYANVYDTKGEDFKADAKFGVVGGAVVKFPMGAYFGIQSEGLFSQKGFKANGSLLGSTYSFTRTTSYLDFPLFFAVKPSEFFTILGGLEYSYLLNQRDVFSSSEASYIQEQTFKQDNIRKNTLGFAAGLDVNLKHITLGARVNWDLFNNNGSGTSSTPQYKNVWFQGTVGYAFYKQ